ncbi:hypothetical protein FRC17_006969 [Serendipita sp. 399]|nr:hypothetical protein FRC17_006969 [Serendipita sp. 399]
MQPHTNPLSTPAQTPTETSIWDVYNNKTWLIDQEMIKDWTSSLNFLLVFAAIFAAVLTAFITESKKLLQEDPQEVLVSAMITFMAQQANGTFKPFERPAFIAPRYAVVTNGFLFSAICSSLLAALASVFALQWIGQYDAELVQALSAKDRALLRHFRYMGVEKWKMAQTIALLPVLLYLSLLLFLCGLVVWMWHIHRTIGGVLIGGLSLSCLFYIVTTVITVLDPSAPFRSPLSKATLAITVQSSRWLANKAALVYHIFSLDSRSYHDPLPHQDTWSTAGEREEHAVKNTLELEPRLFIWMVNNREILKISRRRLMWMIEWGATLPDRPFLEEGVKLMLRQDLLFSASQSFTHTTISQCTHQDLKDITTLWQACQSPMFRDCVSIFKTSFSKLFSLEDLSIEEFGHLLPLAKWRLTPDEPNHLLWWKSTCVRRFASSPPSSTLTIRVHLYILRELCTFMRAKPEAQWSPLFVKYLAETIKLSSNKLRQTSTVLVPRALVDEMLLAMYAVLSQSPTTHYTSDDLLDGVLLNKPFSLQHDLRDSVMAFCDSAILQYCAHLYQAVTIQQTQTLVIAICQLLLLWSRITTGRNDVMQEFMVDLSRESTKLLFRGRYLSARWLSSAHIGSFPHLHVVLGAFIDIKQARLSLRPFCEFSITQEEVQLIEPHLSYDSSAQSLVSGLRKALENSSPEQDQNALIATIDHLMQSPKQASNIPYLLMHMLASGILVNLWDVKPTCPIVNEPLKFLLDAYHPGIFIFPLEHVKTLLESDNPLFFVNFWLRTRRDFRDGIGSFLLREIIQSQGGRYPEIVLQLSNEREEVSVRCFLFCIRKI